MTILALEFSSSQRSVAVVQKNSADEVVESGSSANAPLVMIDEALRAAKIEREQIDCIVVGIGPGSYTGIRAAIAIAQGWQLAREIKLLAVSSTECIAAQAMADGIIGHVNVVIDAQREEFYLAAYEFGRESYREIEPLKIVPMSELRRRVESGEILIGPEVTQWFESGKVVFPRAAMLGELACRRTNFLPGEQLEPIYLRETKFVKAPPPRVLP